MLPQNVSEASAAYESSPLVRSISVLTNASHFGMNIGRMREVKARTTKPVLRKDFIFDEYQIYEARAFGADAILLMANLLREDEMSRLHELALSLGMDALFECHDRDQIHAVPKNAILYGINSRTFAITGGDYAAARNQRAAGRREDLTTDLNRFEELAHDLPKHGIRIAESGVRAENAARLRDELGYHAILVGTSLLTSTAGVHAELGKFEAALA